MSLAILFSKEALLQAAHFVLARLVSVASRKPTSVEYGEIKLIKNAARVEFERVHLLEGRFSEAGASFIRGSSVL